MSASAYTPNLGSIIPPNGDLAGDFWADRAVSHPALLWVPQFVEALPELRPGIAGEYLYPPAVVTAAMFAKRWRINAEVSGSGRTLTLVDHIGDPSSAGSWGAAVKAGTACLVTAEEGAPPDNWINLSIQIGSGNLWFSWGEKEWWPGLQIFLQTRDFEAEGDEFGTAQIGSGAVISGGSSGVSVTFCGQAFPLYYTDDPGPTLSGTIDIQPEDYLSLE